MSAATIVTGALAFFGVVATAVLGYQTNRRKGSGNIRTSEAADLWKEGSTIRVELRADLNRAETRIEGLELAVREQSSKFRKMEREENAQALEIGKIRIEILKCEEREIVLRNRLKEAGLL